MALPSEADELSAAWRALEGAERSPGWRTIQIADGSPSPILAGRRFPENEEALLVGFAAARAPAPFVLPQGRGFQVIEAQLEVKGAGRVWIALSRHGIGRLDLFEMMARDVMSTLATVPPGDDEARLRVFLARIRAWQDFMRSDTDGCLSTEAELGLCGELEMLAALLAAGVPAAIVVEGWRGPLDGLHDFSFGTGAIEVKTTATPNGFLAAVGSLEQLDDSLIRPIFVAAVRLALGSSGETLPERIERIRVSLADDASALSVFGNLLLHAGFIDLAAERYQRKFSNVSVRVLPVSNLFPRITRATAPVEVRSARYDVDLELLSVPDVGLHQALVELGVIQRWS